MKKLLVLLCAVLAFSGTVNAQGFGCENTSTVSVTAAATTEIVPISASSRILVCGFSVAITATGTAKWVYGTGTNCGTGTTDITAAITLATGVPWTAFLSTGHVFRAPPGTALCLAATTGNVLGFVSWNR